MQRINKLNTCFKARSRHCLEPRYNLLILRYTRFPKKSWQDVRAEHIQQMLKEKEGSFVLVWFVLI